MHFDIIHPADPFDHPTRPGHPERPHRLMAAISGLDRLAHPNLRRMTPEAAPLAAALSLHDPRYIDMLSAGFSPGEPPRDLDGGDTEQHKSSLPAALRALGGALGAVDRIAAGTSCGAALAARPPGHHATRSAAMGFCLLGTAALAARHARDVHGMRVAVLDFDVHHGNGTEDLLSEEPDTLFISSQESGLWPGSGAESISGRHNHLVNISLPKGCGSAAFRARWAGALDMVHAFGPDLIVVSAGFDAHANDPLAGLNLSLADYHWLGSEIGALVRMIEAKTLTIVEGGYDLSVLRDGVCEFLAPIITEACGGHLVRRETPRVFAPPKITPYIAGAAPLMGKGPDRFACAKVNGRMWVQDQVTGALVYTPADFVRLHNRAPLEALAKAFTEVGGLDVSAILKLEREARRGGGYRAATSPDYASENA